jgi:acetyl esterase
MIDPQAQNLLDLLSNRNVPTFNALGVMAARELYRDRRGLTQPDAEAVHRSQDHTLHVPASEDTPAAQIQLREYRPDRPGPLPALVYFHGGGWTIGDLETHDVICRSLANRAGCVVLAVNYRLGPEHKFPAAFHDAVAAFKWAAQHAATLGIDPHKIAVGGDSAGGNLAAAVCLALRHAHQRPAYQLLIYPATDLRAIAPSHTTNGSGYLLDSAIIQWFTQNYLRSPEDASDWRASPALASHFTDLPPALVLTAGYDPLRDEGRDYADALSRAGVPCEYLCFERQIHGFITMGRILREAQTAVDICAASLRRALT